LSEQWRQCVLVTSKDTKEKLMSIQFEEILFDQTVFRPMMISDGEVIIEVINFNLKRLNEVITAFPEVYKEFSIRIYTIAQLYFGKDWEAKSIGIKI
jgi:hypothetical protein